MAPWIILGVLVLTVVLILVFKERACKWWDCGEIKRKWKKTEPDTGDYQLDTQKPEGEYDRYYTDMNDWRLEGEQDARDKKASPDC